MPTPSPTVIYVHIHRTAGTTLRQIIQRQYAAPERYYFDDPGHSLAHFRGLSSAHRAKLKLLEGHMEFGLHKHLPQAATYITVLRHPIKRAVSYYHLLRRVPRHPLYNFINDNNLSLLDLIESQKAPLLANGQTRILSGLGGQYSFGTCPPQVLEQAKQNLKQSFSVVGLTERFDETLLLFQRTLGWRNLFYTRENATPQKLQENPIDDHTLALLTEYNQLDLALYDYAVELFKAQVKAQGPQFQTDLTQFRRRNARIAPVLKTYRRAQTWSLRHYLRTKLGLVEPSDSA